MLVSEMRNKVLRACNATDTDVLGDKESVIRDYISLIQQDWAMRTERFTKVAYIMTRASGGESAQQKYSLVMQPGRTRGGLPYQFISVLSAWWKQHPLSAVTHKRYLAELQRNSGSPRYDEPRMFWIENNVMHLWPIPNTAERLRCFYSAMPNTISSDDENIVVQDDMLVFAGVMALVYAQLKDQERAFYFTNLYREAIKKRRDKHVVETDQWTFMGTPDDPNAYIASSTGEYFV